MILNLFYEEPDPDRWLRWDRYPRRWLRRLLRGRPRPGGQMRVFLNLCDGLNRLGVEYRINDYGHAKRHPNELACIIGKPCVLDKIPWKNPILFGASVFSHPLDDPDLLRRLPVRHILVPGEWIRRMFEEYFGDRVTAWPVGIDTDKWKSRPTDPKTTDFLLYDKVRWEHDRYNRELLGPIRNELRMRKLSFREIRYGFYHEEDFQILLRECKAMIFLCEHETQGIAYQQALASGVPILAWDRGGTCQDPHWLALGTSFGPVSSVPYWDERCGIRFPTASQFPSRLNEFWAKLRAETFQPRDYIVENLSLQKCADDYLRLAETCYKS